MSIKDDATPAPVQQLVGCDLTFVCKTHPKTGEIHSLSVEGKMFAALITHPVKKYAYIVPYSDDFIIEGPRAEVWANAVRESKGQFITFVVAPNSPFIPPTTHQPGDGREET
jgi:hypothetical protein